MSEQIHLSQKRLSVAAENREFSRLFDVLTRHFPTMHGRDISWAIEDYLGLANPTLEFRNEISVIPGRHTWIRNLGDAARAALVDDAVSLDLLWILDDHSVDVVYGVGPVGVIGKPFPVAYGTQRETDRFYDPNEHPFVEFDVREFFDDMYQPRDADVTVLVDQNWAGYKKYSVLSLANFENFNRLSIKRAASRVLTSLTEEVYEFDNPEELAQALFSRVYDWVIKNPRIEPLYLSFNLIRELARSYAEDDKDSPRRRRLYEYVGHLPDFDESDPGALKVIAQADKLFHEDREARGSPVSGPSKSAIVLPFKRQDDKRCSLCDALMQLRQNRRNGRSFWGCTNFPKCRHTESAA